MSLEWSFWLLPLLCHHGTLFFRIAERLTKVYSGAWHAAKSQEKDPKDCKEAGCKARMEQLGCLLYICCFQSLRTTFDNLRAS